MRLVASRKRLAVILLGALTIAAALAAPVMAAGQDDNAFPEDFDEAAWLTTVPEQPREGYGFGYLIAQPFNGLAKAILRLPGFQTVDQLVFGVEKPGHRAPEMGGVFYSDEWNRLIMPWYRRFLALASSFALISIIVMVMGYRTVLSSANPRQMATLQETVWNLVVAAMLVAFGPVLARHLFDLNSALVEFVKYGLGAQGVTEIGQTLNGSFEAITTGSPLLDALIRLAYAGLMLHLNLIYMVRKFVLAVLIIVMPVVGWAWVTKGTRLPMLILLSEVATNALMSFTHAVVLALYLTMVRYDGAGMFSTWWAKLFGISLIIPVAALLRRLIAGWLNFLGIDEEKWAGLALAGFGGMVGLASVAGGAVGAFGGMAARNAEILLGGGGSGGGSGGPFRGGFGPASAAGSVLPSAAALPGSGMGLSAGQAPGAAAPVMSAEASPNPVPVSAGAQGGTPSRGRGSEGLDWKSIEDFGGALGRMAGTVAGMAVAGGRMAGDPGAFARTGEMIGRAPLAFTHRAVGVVSTAKRSLDGFRWN